MNRNTKIQIAAQFYSVQFFRLAFEREWKKNHLLSNNFGINSFIAFNLERSHFNELSFLNHMKL